MATPVEVNGDAVGLGSSLYAGGLDESAVELLRVGLLEPIEARCQPSVATVGSHRQGGVEIDVQSHLAGQAVQVEEVHADAQATLNPIAAGVAVISSSGISSKSLERNYVGRSGRGR